MIIKCLICLIVGAAIGFVGAAVKEVQKLCEQALQESIEEKYCIACKHYSYDPWVPGYIAYEGDCDLGHTVFFSWHMDGEKCIDWEDDNE